jgi:hypothetical protein
LSLLLLLLLLLLLHGVIRRVRAPLEMEEVHEFTRRIGENALLQVPRCGGASRDLVEE